VTSNSNDFEIKQRQKWMATLSRSSCQELEDAWQEISEKPDYHYLRKPEIGSIMVRGRVGGRGVQFNLGEITVTRCTLKTSKGIVGVSYIIGRNTRRAELVALFDAILQDPLYYKDVSSTIISRLKASYDKKKAEISKEASTTKVDFFTMVRGE